MKYKRILDNPDKRQEIIDKIIITGVLKGSYDGICSEKTFFDYINYSPQFQQSITQAKDTFRKLLWKSDPNLKSLAIDALRTALTGFSQTWEKAYFSIDEDGKEILTHKTVTTTTQPPARYAILAVLGIGEKAMETEEINKDYLQEIFQDIAGKIRERDMQ